MKKFVDGAADARNRLLYATEGGIPVLAQDIDPLLAAKRGNIFSMLIGFLLIDPYCQKHPSYVRRCAVFLL